MSIQRKATERIELVEMHNLAISIKRLKDVRPYDGERWKRALIHAMGISYVHRNEVKAVREALELP